MLNGLMNRGRLCISFIMLGMVFSSISSIPQSTAQQVPQSAAQIQLSFAPLVAQSSPSVVNIYAKRRTKQRVGLFNDPFFQQFFGGFNLETERLENSLGSGVIVDDTGLVISNLHVIEDAEKINVITHDRREYRAEILLSDQKTDLVVIKLLGVDQALPALTFADAYQSKVGDLVLAIGNPFGVSQTVTSGIVSGLSRTQVNENRFQSFIQTDAAINPGNSGGALIDMQGRLLGINTAIISPTGSSSGLGFAIPVNMLEPLVYAVKNDVPLNRVWLGFQPEPVDSQSAEALGMTFPHGVLIGEIYPDSPAQRAGLKSGDLILSVDGIRLDSPASLRFYMATLIPEKQAYVDLELFSGAKVTMAVNFPPAEPAPDPYLFSGGTFLDGANVVNLSPFVAEHLGIPIFQKGVVIENISRNSQAARLGFQIGDVLRSINGDAFGSVAELRRYFSWNNDARWQIEIWRDGESLSWQIR